MAVASILVLFSLAVFLWHFLKKSRSDVFLNRFSGPKIFPFIGNIWFIARPTERLNNLNVLQQKYGNRVRMTAGPKKLLMVFHPDDVAKVLSSKEMNRSWLYDLLFNDWLGPSCLLTGKGTEYTRMRKLYQPAFAYKHVDNFELNFNAHSKTLLKILRKGAGQGAAVEVRWLLALCTLDNISQYFLGKPLGCLAKFDNDYAAALHTEKKIINQRIYMPWLWPKVCWDLSSFGRKEKVTREYLQHFMDKIVEERKSEILENWNEINLEQTNAEFEKRGTDSLVALDYFLHLQLRGNTECTDRYIRDLMNSAILAGHDSSAAGLTFALYLLAANPKEQAKLHAELDEVFGNDRDRNVESSDLPKLKFLECCIKETERLYPPIPLMPRTSENDFELDKDCVVPKGVDIVVSPWVTHRLPEFFPEPEEFRPSRFFPENCSGRHPYAYLAFSAGTRICMGIKVALAQEKIILADIFRNFTVELDDPNLKVVPVGDIVVFPKNGLKIKFSPR
ncbi:unnamed protein product [Allacma fusca]|uniref:Cytochrome P450 n=1 Tax=Allacma fusca TaxID=39272 RepID=A0A8J2K6J2_9HEXA|nr:unnamed protein product [Allacma fusca]